MAEPHQEVLRQAERAIRAGRDEDERTRHILAEVRRVEKSVEQDHRPRRSGDRQ